MRISWNWLKRYADIDISPEMGAEILTSTGLETESVEHFEPVKGMLRGVVVGHVLSCDPHPDADRLRICNVDVGSEDPLWIVCGAPNVAAGQKVLVATVGSVLHMQDGASITIKKSKIRGQESHGMICAEDELGLGAGHDGIMILEQDAEIGAAAATHLGLTSDHVLEIGLTPNRTDAMGHIGVARDLIAALDHRQGLGIGLLLPDVSEYAQDDDARQVKVTVEDPVACPRYAGVTLTNVQVRPSPEWLQDLLNAIGVRPINNVVDVTNFVQHELGQPLHAFDADTLEKGRIIVRKAGPAEQFTTLDGRQRQLHTHDLVIADGERPACIAGVFGGERSGVTEKTTSVFLESAYFDPGGIRSTARRHALNTDASFRFERGVDPEITVYALKRAALLLKEVASARISSPITDIDHTPKQHREVKVDFREIEKLSGVAISPDEVVRILESLDFRVKERSDRGLLLQVPKYRVDVYRPADVVEEVLRIHGLDHVPIPERLMCPPIIQDALSIERLREQSGAHLAARGCREVMTASLISSERSLNEAGQMNRDPIRLLNPLSAELDVLRPTMLPGMLQVIAFNNNRQQKDLRLFERGRVYGQHDGKLVENDKLSIAFTGAAKRESWRVTAGKVSLFELKEELSALFTRLGLDHLVEWETGEHPYLEHAHSITIKGHAIGVAGEVTKAMLRSYDVGQPVFFAEIDEQKLLAQCRSFEIAYEEIPRTPAVRRDLSLLLDSQVRFSQLRRLAFNTEKKLLKEVDLFDIYEGEKLPPGRKSYAMSFILQDKERTLTDEQVEKAMARIRRALEEAGAELRG